jgi:hypothetical protein
MKLEVVAKENERELRKVCESSPAETRCGTQSLATRSDDPRPSITAAAAAAPLAAQRALYFASLIIDDRSNSAVDLADGFE